MDGRFQRGIYCAGQNLQQTRCDILVVIYACEKTILAMEQMVPAEHVRNNVIRTDKWQFQQIITEYLSSVLITGESGT